MVHPKKLAAAIDTSLKDPLKTVGWVNTTTVGVSREEKPVEWTAGDQENSCDNITGK